ncbi:MAG TPA: hypothetical protein VGU01_10150 [Sphingomicrobium sp.]|nr:hypothetical protein [Sphingomicrobium sp.]
MSCFGKQVHAAGDRRTVARRPTFAAGSAVSVGGSRSIVVENLCAKGAKVAGRGLPEVGKKILIWMDEIDVLGSVVWSQFGHCGVLFDESGETTA